MEDLSKSLARKQLPQRDPNDPFKGVVPRGNKKQTRYFIDNEYVELGFSDALPARAYLVYSVLARHAHNEKQTCFPSLNTIMRKAGIKNRSLTVEYIRLLESCSLISVYRSAGRKPNRYMLIDSSYWKLPDSNGSEPVEPKSTVTSSNTQQSPQGTETGDASVTGSLITESAYEIPTSNEVGKEGSVYSHVYNFYSSNYQLKDIQEAISYLIGQDGKTNLKEVGQLLRDRANSHIIVPIKPPRWM